MVCLATPLKVKSERELKETPKIPGVQDVAMSDNNDDDRLKVRRVAGGSIIEHPPLFSPDEDALLIVFNHLVQVYSTTTGEWLRDLEAPSSTYGKIQEESKGEDGIVALHYELHDSEIVVALTVAGDLIRWKWKTGSVASQTKLPMRNVCFRSFHFVDLLPNSSSVFVTFSQFPVPDVGWDVVDTRNGESLYVDGKMYFKRDRMVVAVENQFHHYVAVVQGIFLYIMNYKNGTSNRGVSANKIPFTTVRVHPTEEMIATGDEWGRVFLWRCIYKPYPITSLYHWHHTPITSISFTHSGTGFYSSGQEAVLVQWNMDRPDLKNFLPRVSACILHIAVGEENRKIAICTADNGIQILGAQFEAKCVLQSFTYIYNDKTGLGKFPVGLKVDPRTNSLVLNGNTGHLQFYSTYTRRLLYNIDIVIQNQLPMETDSILYNIRVTLAAFNIDWMVTAEVWDDQEHSPELRLKFWLFNNKKQRYTLNTNIEGPHELGIKALEFSSAVEDSNLLCATAGHDNFIKLWALEDSNSIDRRAKVWFCIEQTNYKMFTLDCISFSQDGSLLSAGFGNVLCIYKAENLKLKAELSAPGVLGGIVSKVEITLPKESLNGSQRNQIGNKNELIEKRKKTLELFKVLLEGNDQGLIQTITKDKLPEKKRKTLDNRKGIALTSVNDKQREFLFQKIRSLTDLSLFQKIDLFQKLGIYCSVPRESQQQLITYLTRNILNKNYIEKNLDNSIRNINSRHRFKAKYRLNQYLVRKQRVGSHRLIPIVDLFHLKDGRKRRNSNVTKEINCNGLNGNDDEVKSEDDCEKHILPPLQTAAAVKHVAFGTGEHAHLVVVCTANRVLIWNILTLRLQSVLRLSVDKIVVDPLTSLFAAFTINAELYVFLPNAPIPLYHRINVPKIHAAAWVARRYPKSQSLNIDWQSLSTLYFITEQQELVYLAADNDLSETATAYLNEPQDVVRFSIFGAFAAKKASSKVAYTPKHSSTSIGVPGKESVKAFIESATHTMAPTHLLSYNFIKALMRTETEKKQITPEDSVKVVEDEQDSDDDDDDNDFRMKLQQIRINNNSSELPNDAVDKCKQIKQHEKLKNFINEKIDIKF